MEGHFSYLNHILMTTNWYWSMDDQMSFSLPHLQKMGAVKNLQTGVKEKGIFSGGNILIMIKA